MKYSTLIIMCWLLSTAAHATFELEDPADPKKQLEMEKKQKPIFGSKTVSDQVIIVTGTTFYSPSIEDGRCAAWRAETTEEGSGQSGNTPRAASGNLLGQVVKTIECTKGSSMLELSLVQTGVEGLVWVESGKLLDAD